MNFVLQHRDENRSNLSENKDEMGQKEAKMIRYVSSNFAVRTLASNSETAAVAYWLESPPCERGVVGSIPGRDRPKSSKLVVVTFSLGAQDYGNSTTAGPPVSG